MNCSWLQLSSFTKLILQMGRLTVLLMAVRINDRMVQLKFSALDLPRLPRPARPGGQRPSRSRAVEADVGPAW